MPVIGSGGAAMSGEPVQPHGRQKNLETRQEEARGYTVQVRAAECLPMAPFGGRNCAIAARMQCDGVEAPFHPTLDAARLAGFPRDAAAAQPRNLRIRQRPPRGQHLGGHAVTTCCLAQLQPALGLGAILKQQRRPSNPSSHKPRQNPIWPCVRGGPQRVPCQCT